MLNQVLKKEKEAGIKPDPEIDAFMKATAIQGQESSLNTDYVLKVCDYLNQAKWGYNHRFWYSNFRICYILYH